MLRCGKAANKFCYFRLQPMFLSVKGCQLCSIFAITIHVLVCICGSLGLAFEGPLFCCSHQEGWAQIERGTSAGVQWTGRWAAFERLQDHRSQGVNFYISSLQRTFPDSCYGVPIWLRVVSYWTLPVNWRCYGLCWRRRHAIPRHLEIRPCRSGLDDYKSQNMII